MKETADEFQLYEPLQLDFPRKSVTLNTEGVKMISVKKIIKNQL